MKKYLAAAAVAVMVFAFSAFAAALDVDGGTVQAGMDTDLACFEDAELSYATGYDQSEGSPTEEPFLVMAITVSLSGGDSDCINDDLRGHLKVNDGGAEGTASSRVGPHGYAIVPLEDVDATAGTASFTVEVDGDRLPVEDLHQVQVMIKEWQNQGEMDGYDGGANSVFEGTI